MLTLFDEITTQPSHASFAAGLGLPIVYSVLLAALYIFALKATCKIQAGKLTLHPDPAKRTELSLIVGELHHPRTQMPSETPHRLVIPKRGLFTDIAGLTSGVVIPTWQT